MNADLRAPFFVNVLANYDYRAEAHSVLALEKAVRKSVETGFDYTLVTTGGQRLDPFVVAQYGLSLDPRFAPLIAVNPANQHPIECAKRLLSLQEIYPNRMALNFVTGAFGSDAKAVGENLDYAERCERLTEFVETVGELLSRNRQFSAQGKYFKVGEVLLKMGPQMDGQQRPPADLFVSGTKRGFKTPWESSCYFVRTLRPPQDQESSPDPRHGLLLGILARPTQSEAEQAALSIFPSDRKGAMLFDLSLKTMRRTPWLDWIHDHFSNLRLEDPDYNLNPLRNFHSPVPYVVGSYDRIAERLRSWTRMNFNFFILDFPATDFGHVSKVLEHFRGVTPR